MSYSYRLDEFLARSTDKAFEETELSKVLAALPSCAPDGPWLAGGALRRTIEGKEPDSDFDFFFRDESQLIDFTLNLHDRGLKKVRETEHHLHYRGQIGDSKIDRDVQAIKFAYYDRAESVIDSFDFTICQFAYDGETLTCGDYAVWDLGRRRLAVNKITYPVASMRRVLKYGRQGFTACNGALSELLRQTAQSPENLARLNIAYVD